MLSHWRGRPGIAGGFDGSHRPVVGTFDRFNGLSSNILLTFCCYFDNPQMPWGGAFELKLSAQFKRPSLCSVGELNFSQDFMDERIGIASVTETLLKVLFVLKKSP